MSFMPSVNYAECRKQAHYAECRYAECRYAEYRGTLNCDTQHKELKQTVSISIKCHDVYLIFYCYTECRYAVCQYAECRYAERHGVFKRASHERLYPDANSQIIQNR